MKSAVDKSQHLKSLWAGSPPLPITTAFPSTTSTVMTTISTGMSPAQHGILGYSMYLKEIGAIANMLDFKIINSSRDESLFDKGISPDTFLGAPTLFERLGREGVHPYVLTKGYILGSGLSRLTQAGAATLGYIEVGDMFVALRRLLEGQAGLRKYIFVYWPIVDGASHGFGPWSEETMAEIRNFFFSMQEEFLQRLSKKSKEDTLLFLTADHGQSQIEEGGIFDTSADEKFMDMLVIPPTGDSRTAFLHVKSGKEAKIAERLSTRFGDSYQTITVDEALKQGLFGPGKPRRELRDRAGDVIVLSKAGRAIFYPFKANSMYTHKGAHSGLTADEMLVPLFELSMQDLR